MRLSELIDKAIANDPPESPFEQFVAWLIKNVRGAVAEENYEQQGVISLVALNNRTDGVIIADGNRHYVQILVVDDTNLRVIGFEKTEHLKYRVGQSSSPFVIDNNGEELTGTNFLNRVCMYATKAIDTLAPFGK